MNATERKALEELVREWREEAAKQGVLHPAGIRAVFSIHAKQLEAALTRQPEDTTP